MSIFWKRIEHLWDQVKRAIDRRVDENTSLADLRRLVQEEWNAIPQHRVARLINTMRDRCRQAINRRGGNTPYWSFCNFWNGLFLHSKCAHSNIKTAVGFEPRFKCCYDSVIYVCHFDWLNNFWNIRQNPKGNLFLLNCLSVLIHNPVHTIFSHCFHSISGTFN